MQGAISGAILGEFLSEIQKSRLSKFSGPSGPSGFKHLQTLECLSLHVHVLQGFAFVQFKNASEAREAMTAMNGFQLAGTGGSPAGWFSFLFIWEIHQIYDLGLPLGQLHIYYTRSPYGGFHK